MRKLWVFGDSFSTPFNLYKEYCDYKGYTPKTYYENVSEQFNLEIESHGFGGADNHTILDKVIDHIERIRPNDIVIIGWTDWFRTRVVNDNGEWECLNPGHINQPTINLTNYNINSIKSIILNRDHQKYIDEQNNIIKLVKFALKNNILIDWCWIDEYNLLDCEVKHIGRQKTILEETNKVIPDYHWCEEGHLNLSNKIIDHIHQKKSIDKVKVI